MTRDLADDDELVPVPGQVEVDDPYRVAPSAVRWLCASAMLLVSTWLMFWNLGAYGLWVDEADTALYAQAIWETGDTTARHGHNLYAYHNGEQLTDLRNRYHAPLSYYLLAPFVGKWGNDPFVLRAPFALCGLAMVVLAVVWLVQKQANTVEWLATLAVGMGSASFFLYARQCRYYSVAMLASALVVYFYARHQGRWHTFLGLFLATLALLLSQYLNFAAIVVVLGVDYALWQRHVFVWRRTPALLWLLPTFIIAVGLWLFRSGGLPAGNGVLDRARLLVWNLRDLNACESLSLVLLCLAPLVWFVTRDALLLRWPLATLLYALVVAALSPQPVEGASVADVRYLAPLVPLGIALAARMWYWLGMFAGWKSVPIVLLATFTNVLYLLGSLVAEGWSSGGNLATEIERTLRSTPYQLAREIAAPRATASRTVSSWIVEHVQPGESVWVVPGEETYPHMVQAPAAQYAWQLNHPVAEQFAGLPTIHTYLHDPVDVMIVYGPYVDAPLFVQLLNSLKAAGHDYRQVAALDIFWDDAIRPELFWHRFQPLERFRSANQAISIYRLERP